MSAKTLGWLFVFCWFFFGGIAHFLQTDFFVGIVPPSIPRPTEVVYVTGVLEIAGALALWSPGWRRYAGWGLFALTVCVTPANLHMWLNPGLFPEVPEWFLSARLVVQVALLACIWWATRPDPRETASTP